MPQLATETWDGVLAALARRVAPQSFGTWFRHLELLAATPERVELGVPNRFIREWMERHYAELVRSAFAEACGLRPEVVFSISPAMYRRLRAEQQAAEAEGATPDPTPSAPPAAPAPPLPFAAAGAPASAPSRLAPATSPARDPLAPQHTFARFVAGPTNHLAAAAARAVAERPGARYNPLFLCGPSGTGKTHLLQAICAARVAAADGGRVRYVTSERFVSDFLAAVGASRPVEGGRAGREAGGPTLEAFRARYRELDLLALDDLHLLASKPGTQEELCRTIESLVHTGRQVVLAAPRAPKELAGLSEALAGRLLGGLVVGLEPPCEATRLALLRDQAARLGLRLDEEVLAFLARRLGGSARELNGTLARLSALGELAGRAPDLAAARAALRALVTLPGAAGAPRGRPAPEAVVEAVARKCGCTAKELRSRGRGERVLRARQLVAYLCRKLTEASLSEIGAACGGLTHSTVLHSVHKIGELLPADPALARRVEDLLDELGGD